MAVKLSAAWLILMAAAALFAPMVLEEPQQQMDFTQVLQAPSGEHLFGTDSLGRDIFTRTLYGARVSLGVAASAVALAVLIGLLVGLLAGYLGGWVDRLLMGLVDVFLCFPALFLILALMAVWGPHLWHVAAVIGITGWMGTARLVRAEVLSLKEREFILASRVLGAGTARILFKHLLPNAAGPVLVSAILGFSAAILTETGLSFLGIGVQPPTPSWGNLLMDGKAVLGVAWWQVFFPGAMIFLSALSVNVIGERWQTRIEGRAAGAPPLMAVEDLNSRIAAGSFTALVGETGSGKTTAALALGARKETAYVFQDPASALNPVMRVGRQIDEVTGGREKSLAALGEVGLGERAYTSYPHELSGGEKQRSLIAMALAQGPRLLIADEPTSALDKTSEAAVMGLLAELKKKKGLTVLFITHDLDLARRHADTVHVMRAGRIVPPGDPYIKALYDAVRSLESHKTI